MSQMNKDTQIDMDKIREKVRLLLNLTTEKGATEAEAATAMAIALRLLEKYNLAMSDIGNNSPESELGSESMNGLHYQWESSLAQSIAKHNMCDFIRYNSRYVIIGRRINMESAIEMYRWIAVQLTNMIYNYVDKRPEYISTVKWRNNFLWGATTRVQARLSELQNERHTMETDCKALVLNRQSEAKDFRMNVLFPNQRWTTTTRKQRIGEGFREGREAGDEVRLTPEKSLSYCTERLE